MAREIKFRAWDKEQEILHPVQDLQFGNNGKTHVFLALGEDICSEGFAPEKFDLMQFTGLLDKNGKEIFVGDVIKIKCNEDIIIGDVFYNQSRCCYMINHPAGYNGSFGLHTLTIEICDEFNIIGNLYQNPELLGGQDE